MRADAGNNEGTTTTASGANSHAEGQSTTASGVNSHAQGTATTASGDNSHAEGNLTMASGTNSHAEGQRSVASRLAQRATSAGLFASAGDAQAGGMVLRRESTDATAGVLTAANAAVALTGASTNVLTIPVSRAYMLRIDAVARRTDVQGEMAGFIWEGLVGRDSTGSARIIGTPTTDKWNDVSAALWALGVSIDTTDATNNYVKVTATGELTKTIRWVAKMEWVEVAS